MEQRDGVDCANCGRFLRADPYAGLSQPKEDAPPERIHRINEPDWQGMSFLCTCGHFTIVDLPGAPPLGAE
jgi:hypothetical protein